jgi:pyridoxal phosphate enzyme (YggS family)
MTVPDLDERLAGVRERVAAAERAAGRPAGEVDVLLATKTQPAELIAAAVLAGFALIGENRVQELVGKAPDLAEALAGVPFARHFIGHLQPNKVRSLLPLVDCVQTVHDAVLAARLATVAAQSDRVLDVFVQVNVSGEDSKSGVAPEGAVELAKAVLAEPALRLRGLMTIGLNSPDPAAVAGGYRLLRSLGAEVRALAGGSAAGELSMGMSGDLELAVTEGATIVRVGTAVFGARP